MPREARPRGGLEMRFSASRSIPNRPKL
jgi:hypothetical protein